MKFAEREKICIDILKNFPDNLIVLDENLECKYINQTAENNFCLNVDKYIDVDISNFCLGDSLEDFKQNCYKTLDDGEIRTCKCYFFYDSEQQINIQVKITKINNNLLLYIEKSGETLGSVHNDIELNAIQSLLLGIECPVYLKDKNYRYIAVNDKFAELFSLPKENFIGKKLEEVRRGAPKYLEKYKEILSDQAKIFSGELSKSSICTDFKDVDGKVKRCYTMMVPLKENCEIIGLVCVVFIVSELPTIDNEINLLAEAINHLSEGVVITNSYGVIQYINPTYEKMSGYMLEEMVGKTPRILKSGKHSQKVYKELWAKIMNAEMWEGVLINRKKDGVLYKEKASIFPVLDDGHITNFVAIKRDITHEVELEEQLRQAQKMESIGRLAGGISHDFNNIITVVLGYTELLLSQVDASNDICRPLNEIKKSCKRAVALTKHLLAFSRKQVLQMKRVDVNDIVGSMVKMLQRIIGENITLNVHFQHKILPILSNITMIEQIIMNMVINARDALKGCEDAYISIETDMQYIRESVNDGDFKSDPGTYTVIKISDNGTGMSDETRKLIFEPFFTTKQETSGTGLGLSTVYGIVKQHNGFIRIESELGKGTIFEIYLPYNDSSVEELSFSRTSGVIQEGEGVILILEDDRALLHLLQSALIKAGYSVIAATSSEELYKNLPECKINLLLADIMLKGERGDDLAMQLRGKYKNMKILFMSGYPDRLNANSQFFNIPDCDFLQKPFTIAQITRHIKALLHESEEDNSDS
jgi:PAS domain S-box-containing protein